MAANPHNTARVIQRAVVALLIANGAAYAQTAVGDRSPKPPPTPLGLETGLIRPSSSSCPYIARVCALIADPAIRAFVGLAENAWDFTAPGGVPGFEAMPPPNSERLIASSNAN